MAVARTLSGPLTLRANFRWTFAGHVVNVACLWGVIALFAQLAGPSALGQFSLGNAIAAPVMAVAMFQLRALLVTDARGEYPFADYFGARVFWTFLGLIAVAAVAIVWRLSSETMVIVLLVGAARAADSLSDIVRGLFQRLERMNYSGASLMIRGPVSLAATGFAMIWTDSAVWATAALAGSWLLSFVAYDLLVAERLLRNLRPPELGERLAIRIKRGPTLQLTWVALPLGVVMGIISLQLNVPRYAIQGYTGEEALGYFSAPAYPMIAAVMIFTALGQAAAPRLARQFVEDPSGFQRLLAKLAGIAVVCGLGLIAAVVALGRPALAILYGPEYAEYQPAFVVLAVATAIQLVATCYGYGLTAARYIRIQVVLVSVSCLATIGAAVVLVPRWGVQGGAWAVVVTSLTMLILFYATSHWAIRRRGDKLNMAEQAGSAPGPGSGLG